VSQVPWAHLLFGLDALLEIRRDSIGIRGPERRWEDTGLNRRRFTEFKFAARTAGFLLDRFDRIPVKGLRGLARLPLVGDLFTFGIDCVARKPGSPRAHRPGGITP